jgi:hypothetical protein
MRSTLAAWNAISDTSSPFIKRLDNDLPEL